MYSLIVTAKMNDVDPQAWLAGGHASPSIQSKGSTNSFHRIGAAKASKSIRQPK
jgi:hypothetical protein